MSTRASTTYRAALVLLWVVLSTGSTVERSVPVLVPETRPTGRTTPAEIEAIHQEQARLDAAYEAGEISASEHHAAHVALLMDAYRRTSR